MRLFYLLIFSVFFLACKEKKINLEGNEPVKVNDFMAAFQPLQTPITITDTGLIRIGDTLKIGKKVLQQFLPDSIVQQKLTEINKSIIHPIGKIEKETEIYLLLKEQYQKKAALHVLVMNEKNEFIAHKLLLTNNYSDYKNSVIINREPTFSINKEKMDTEKQLLKYTRVGWAFTASVGSFINVVNETNEDEKRNNTILNPIDTLARKYKYSGDYVQNDKNFISIRDGAKPNTYLFFIHFEKNNGTCIGELKGDIKMKDDKEGIYSENNDPCLIDFKFSKNEITVKEQGSCGNYRGIKCYFNDSFRKKKK